MDFSGNWVVPVGKVTVRIRHGKRVWTGTFLLPERPPAEMEDIIVGNNVLEQLGEHVEAVVPEKGLEEWRGYEKPIAC